MCKDKMKRHKKDCFIKKNYYRKTKRIIKLKACYLIIVLICVLISGFIMYKNGISNVCNSFTNFSNIRVYDYNNKVEYGKQEANNIIEKFEEKKIAENIKEENIQIKNVKYLEYTYEDSNFIIINYELTDDKKQTILESTAAYRNGEFYADTKDIDIVINEESGISKFEENERKSKAELLKQIIEQNKKELIDIEINQPLKIDM